jgi:1-aminocyclopropane-1-carboxylate deaminase/D-cysteine desulfhydrase-like pyridoxal-dependent ACC family enzyme
MIQLFNHGTPIEVYELGGRRVLVKREDLCTNPPLPPLAKLRGAWHLLQKLKGDGVKAVGHYDTRVSRAGQGLAILTQALGLEFHLFTPKPNGLLMPEQIDVARQHGAILHFMRHNFTPINYAVAKRQLEQDGGYMLPFGVSCPEAVVAVAHEAGQIDFPIDILVISVGSATILAGVLYGLRYLPKRIIGISAGLSNAKQRRNLVRLLYQVCTPLERIAAIVSRLQLLPPIMPYSQADNFPCPFPSSPYYDRKAWHWLAQNIESLPHGQILFWNIGSR